MLSLPDEMHLFDGMAQKSDAGNYSQTERIQRKETGTVWR